MWHWQCSLHRSPRSPAWERWRLGNAANGVHLAESLGLDARGGPVPAASTWRAHRIAWAAGCVLFDRAALLEAGGFDFWREVPENAHGEDVLVQQRVMARRGGAGILPSESVSPTSNVAGACWFGGTEPGCASAEAVARSWATTATCRAPPKFAPATRSLGADPLRRQPVEHTAGEERKRVRRRMRSLPMRQAFELGGHAQNGLERLGLRGV